ncbi:MAG: hypothetical protein U0326_44515 [Polyangiales bacterium]
MLRRALRALTFGLGLGILGAGIGWPLGIGLSEVLDVGSLERQVRIVVLSIVAGGAFGLAAGLVLASTWRRRSDGR